MADELDAALTELETLIGTITGFSSEPTEPPTDYDAFPFYVVEMDTGTLQTISAGFAHAMHDVSIQIHFGLPTTVTPSDSTAARHYIDLVKDKLLLGDNVTLSDTVDTILSSSDDPITYTWGLIGYRGIPTIGLEITVTLKIDSKEESGAFVKG